ncbi:MAG: GvpL/GvpF family gas vesicle protein [Flammeovirgaceae bacterium]
MKSLNNSQKQNESYIYAYGIVAKQHTPAIEGIAQQVVHYLPFHNAFSLAYSSISTLGYQSLFNLSTIDSTQQTSDTKQLANYLKEHQSTQQQLLNEHCFLPFRYAMVFSTKTAALNFLAEYDHKLQLACTQLAGLCEFQIQLAKAQTVPQEASSSGTVFFKKRYQRYQLRQQQLTQFHQLQEQLQAWSITSVTKLDESGKTIIALPLCEVASFKTQLSQLLASQFPQLSLTISGPWSPHYLTANYI